MEAKARKVAVQVEVRALSGTLIASLELSASATVAEVKERLNLGKSFDLACGAELLLDGIELRELKAPVELCLVWRRRGFAYIADVHGCLSLWDLETGTVERRRRAAETWFPRAARLAVFHVPPAVPCVRGGGLAVAAGALLLGGWNAPAVGPTR